MKVARHQIREILLRSASIIDDGSISRASREMTRAAKRDPVGSTKSAERDPRIHLRESRPTGYEDGAEMSPWHVDTVGLRKISF